MLRVDVVSLPASKFAAEVALMQSADRKRERRLQLTLNRLGSDDKFGIGRILATLIHTYMEP